MDLFPPGFCLKPLAKLFSSFLADDIAAMIVGDQPQQRGYRCLQGDADGVWVDSLDFFE